MPKYERIQEADLEAMTAIYKRYLNKGESIGSQIRQGFYESQFVGVKCIDKTGGICGIISGFKGIRFTCGHEELVNKIKKKYKDESIYTTEMLVVLPGKRHQGIGEELVRRFKKQLDQTDAKYLLSELWRKPGGKVPGKVIVEVLGNEVEHWYLANFYKDLAKYKLTCPICGENCICGADISLIKL